MTHGLRMDQIGQIHVSVEEIGRAVAFYRDVLGMKLLFEVPGQDMAFFDCGGIRLYLGRPEGGRRFSPLIYYRVASIVDAHAELVRRGVEFETLPHVVHRTESSELWLADFHDPEGNLLCLMCDLPRT